MKRLIVLLAGLGLYSLYGQCSNCSVSGSPVLPRGFDPTSVTIEVGRDTEVVIQFTWPDTVQMGSSTLYPNYAIYADSLRMASGTTYLVVRGTASDPVTYANNALAFDQAPRYKEVQTGVFANMVVYRNPSPSEAGVPAGQLSPPQGCVRACIKGIQPTPAGTGDSLYIVLRAFIDPNSVNPINLQGTDINNKDTTNLMPDIFSVPLYSDVSLYYGPVYVQSARTVIESTVQGGVVVSPNPAWGIATLRFTTNYPVPGVVRAMDASGRIVYEQNFGVLPAGEHTAALKLPAGIYILELLAGKESCKSRLIVLGE